MYIKCDRTLFIRNRWTDINVLQVCTHIQMHTHTMVGQAKVYVHTSLIYLFGAGRAKGMGGKWRGKGNGGMVG